MSTGFLRFDLEQTIISQAHEIARLKRDASYMTDKFYEAEKKYQEKLEKSERYGGAIRTIGQILADEDLAFEEHIVTIQALVDQCEGQENHE